MEILSHMMGIETRSGYVFETIKAMCRAFSLCLSHSAGSAIEAISLLYFIVKHRCDTVP